MAKLDIKKLFEADSEPIIKDDVKIAVLMKGITSMEHYTDDSGAERRVLDGIDLSVPVGCIYGVTGRDRFALELIAETAGSLKPYGGGRCVLMELGSMRKKGRILPHVFYVNDQDVLYDHMQVLRYLMFATEHMDGSAKERQVRWLELMLNIGTYRMALAYINFLTRSEKALVSLMLAAESNAHLVVADLSGVKIPRERYPEFARLFVYMAKKKKTVLVCNDSYSFIDRCCTHAALIKDGVTAADGTVRALCEKYDHRIVTIYVQNSGAAAAAIRERWPNLRAVALEGRLKLYGEAETDVLAIMRELEERKIAADGMVKGKKTLDEAFLEVERT